MEIPKISVWGNFLAGQAHEMNHSLVLIVGNLQPTQDEVFHVGN